MGPDDEGHCLTGSITTELMSGSDVRILIPRNTDASLVATLLRKAAEWFDRGGLNFDEDDILVSRDPSV